MGAADIDLDIDEEEQSQEKQPLIRELIEFCGGPDLIEVFGGSGSGKTVFSIEVLKSLLDNTDKKALFIDTERNIGDINDISGAEYCYIPEWKDIYYYIRGVESEISESGVSMNTSNERILKDGYDLVILDSVGFPALVQYADYRVDNDADQFQVFLEIESIFGHLKQYSQKNDCLIIVTNQPKSDLSGEENPAPFGDKAIYGAKEVWKTEIESTNEVKTKCHVKSFRSRQAGRGKKLFELDIDDGGIDVKRLSEESEIEEWT